MSAKLQVVPSRIGVFLVPVEFVPREWAAIHDLLEPAVERSAGRWTMKSLLQSLCVGHLHLWIIRDGSEVVAAATTQFVEYPHRKMLSVQFLGGKGIEDWIDELLIMFERFSRDTQCDGVEAVARFGFWPTMKRNGYSRKYCVYDLILEDSE